jgi:hypothetical protein
MTSPTIITMNECEAPSQEKINTEASTLTIENSTFVAQSKRGLHCEDGCSFSITFSTLLILAFWALIAYIIYVYGFNYGSWDPNYRYYCNNNFNGVNNCG